MIIHRYAELPVEYMEDRDLRVLMDTTSVGQGRLSLAEETFQPGQFIPPHHHTGLEEVYHVKVGQGRMRVGEEETIVRAGDTILIPTDTIHSLHNDSRMLL